MKEFILEEQIKNVKSSNTKEYLKEVLSSYRNENYRACVVVLYTVVVYDLLEKVNILKEVYHDKEAEKIIECVKKNQNNQKNKAEWEQKLFEDICTEMNIITEVEKEELLHLKRERNKAAHPVINMEYENLELKQITKETAADLIRKAFEIVFLKDAILAKKLEDDIIKDLKDYYSRLKLDGLEIFINAKYYSRMTEVRKDSLFKTLWKLVFILKNDDCDRGREPNFLGLLYLYRGNREHYRKLMTKDKDFYFNKIEVETFADWSKDEVSNGYEPILDLFKKFSRMITFIRFIQYNPEIYRDLSDYAKNTVGQSIKKMYMQVDVMETTLYQYGLLGEEKYKVFFKEQFLLEAKAMILSDDAEKHFDKIFKMIKNYQITRNYDWIETANYYVLEKDDLDILFKQSEYISCIDDFLEFLIKYCTGADSFNQAIWLFEHLKDYQSYFKQKHYDYILIRMNLNPQFYDNHSKEKMLSELEIMYEEKFKSKLASTLEERFIYHHLYSKENGYDLAKVFDILEKNALLSSDFWLQDVMRRIEEEQNQSFVSVLKQNTLAHYPNIVRKLSDKSDINSKDDWLEKFEEYFK